MATKHAYVEESLRGRYLLCAAIVRPSDAAETRRVLQDLRRPGQRRIHMRHESDRRRRQILSAVSALDVEVHLYDTTIGRRSDRTARDDCLRALVCDLGRLEVDRLVLEGCGQDHADNQVVREAVRSHAEPERLDYLHATPAAGPLLWIPDIVAWAHGRGGDWLRRTKAVLTKATRLDS